MSGARERFAAQVAAPEEVLDLGYAALWLAAEEYPGLDVDAYATRFDAMAGAVAARPPRTAAPLGRLEALSAHLFGELGFRGNADEYYDPRNSFLNEVLDRRLGIPITLAVVFLEVGWRLGLPLAGVGLPAHFVVGYYGDAAPHYVDVFAGGLVLTREECLEHLRGRLGANFSPTDEQWAPVSKRQILGRMLTNLKGIYFGQEDWNRALAAVERLVLLEPASATELRDRGLVQARRGALRAARDDLADYLARVPNAPDREAVRQQLALVERLRGMQN